MALPSRYIPRSRPAPLRWYGDPRDELAKRGTDWRSSLTPSDATGMLAYNKRLYSPDGGAGAFAPPVSPQQPPLQAGWRATQMPASRERLAGIASRYGGAPIAPLPSPTGIGSSPFRTVSSNPNVQPTNPNLLTEDSSLQSPGYVPGMPAGYKPPQTGAAGPVGEPGYENPNLSSAEPVENPNLTGDASVSDRTMSPLTNTTTGGGYTARGEVDKAHELFMEKGGSQRTWNKGMVAAGIRPRIDARATPSARNYIPDPVEFRNGGTPLGTGAPVRFVNDKPVKFDNNYSGHLWQPSQEVSNMQLPY